MRKCRYCGFKNPNTASHCLQCNKDLPTTVGEVRQAFEVIEDITKGRVGRAGEKVAKGVVRGEIEQAKLRFNPIWWLRVKVFRAKQSCITCLVIWAIILAMALIGGIISKFQGR